jgi:hypothetical protein
VTLRATRDGLAGQDADLILGLLTAMRRDPNIAATVRSRMVETKLAAFAPAVRAAQERGEVPADADHRLVAEVGSAMLFSRGLLTGAPLDDDFLQHLVDEVLVPVLTAPRRDPAC